MAVVLPPGVLHCTAVWPLWMLQLVGMGVPASGELPLSGRPAKPFACPASDLWGLPGDASQGCISQGSAALSLLTPLAAGALARLSAKESGWAILIGPAPSAVQASSASASWLLSPSAEGSTRVRASVLLAGLTSSTGAGIH